METKYPTEEEIQKMPVKWMSVEQYGRHVARFGLRANIEGLGREEHGAFLGIWQKKSGERVRLHLQRIFIKKYSLKYGTTHKKGGEILISNCKIPKYPII